MKQRYNPFSEGIQDHAHAKTPVQKAPKAL